MSVIAVETFICPTSAALVSSDNYVQQGWAASGVLRGSSGNKKASTRLRSGSPQIPTTKSKYYFQKVSFITDVTIILLGQLIAQLNQLQAHVRGNRLVTASIR